MFVVDLGAAQLIILRNEIAQVIKRNKDSVLFLDLGLAADVEASLRRLGRSRDITPRTSLIV